MDPQLHAVTASANASSTPRPLWQWLGAQSSQLMELLDAARLTPGAQPPLELLQALQRRLLVDEQVLLPALAALQPLAPAEADAQQRVDRLREIAVRLSDPALAAPGRQLLLGLLEGLWQLHEAVISGDLVHHRWQLPWPQLQERAEQLLRKESGQQLELRM